MAIAHRSLPRPSGLVPAMIAAVRAACADAEQFGLPSALPTLLEAVDTLREALRRVRVRAILAGIGGGDRLVAPADDPPIDVSAETEADALVASVEALLARALADGTISPADDRRYEYFLTRLAGKGLSRRRDRAIDAVTAETAAWASLHRTVTQGGSSATGTSALARTVAAQALDGVLRTTRWVAGASGCDSILTFTLAEETLTARDIAVIMSALRGSLPALRAHITDSLPAQCTPPPHYPADEAAAILVPAFERWSSEWGEFACEAFDSGRVELYPPRPGETARGVCGLLDRGRSVVKVAYDGSPRALFVLAHELGHAFHYYLTPHDSYLRRLLPTCVAEMGATLGEHLLYDELRRRETPGTATRIRAGWLTRNLVDTSCFHEFETAVVARAAEPGALTAEWLDEALGECIRAAYGDLRDERPEPTDWTRRRHLYGRPFANWQYAFAHLAATAVVQRWRADASTQDRYRVAMARSGTATVADTLAALGCPMDEHGSWVRQTDLVAGG